MPFIQYQYLNDVIIHIILFFHTSLNDKFYFLTNFLKTLFVCFLLETVKCVNCRTAIFLFLLFCCCFNNEVSFFTKVKQRIKYKVKYTVINGTF